MDTQTTINAIIALSGVISSLSVAGKTDNIDVIVNKILELTANLK
jgi:hypothetical protein